MLSDCNNSSTNSFDVSRDRAIRLFSFLRSISELRTTTTRSLDQYEEVIWLDTIPRSPGCYCAVWNPDDASNSDVWVEITKPKLLSPPIPPEELAQWIKPTTLDDSSEESPELYENIVVEEVGEPDGNGNAVPLTVVHYLADYPNLKQTWERYLQVSWHPWAKRDRELRKVQAVYNGLFSVYQRQQRLGEAYEVVIGFGLLTWRVQSGQNVKRHLVTTQLNLSFDPTRGRVSVTPCADGARPTLEQDMLEPEQCPEANELRVVEQFIGEMGDSIWAENRIHTALKAWVNANPDSRTYSDSITAHGEIQNYPIVSFAPAIILRKRTERSLVRVFKDICEQLRSEDTPVPQGVRVLVDDPDDKRSEGEIPQASSDLLAHDSEVYFPLLANDQQTEIARQIAGKQGVLVQGPPGTGKSHTIANLVCHLLATGNRVLVTSHTARALKVLRGKFPAEIAPLCVIALGDDSQSMKDLEASVHSITQQQNAWNPAENKRSIDSLEKKLDAARRSEAKLKSDLRAIRESETFRHEVKFGSYSGTLQSIAARLSNETNPLGWLPLVPVEDAEPPLTDSETTALLQMLREFDQATRTKLNLRLIDPSLLPSPSDFGAYVARESDAKQSYKAGSEIHARLEYMPVSSCNGEVRHKLISSLRDIIQDATPFLKDSRSWVQAAASDTLSGRNRAWVEILRITRAHLDAIGEHARTAGEYSVDGLDGVGRSLAKACAEGLLEHLRSGGKLGIGPFRPRPVKDARFLIEGVRVNGRLCSSCEPLQELLTWIDVADRFDALDGYWGNYIVPPTSAFPVRKAEYEGYCGLLSDVISLAQRVNTSKEVIASIDGLGEPLWGDLTALARLEETGRSVSLQEDLEKAQQAFNSVERLANECCLDPTAHPTAKRLSKAVVARDTEGYASVYRELEELDRSKKRLEKLYASYEVLRKASESFAQSLLDTATDSSWDDRMARFEAAWNWRRADSWLRRLSSPHEQQRLSSALDAQRQIIQKTLADLASAKAWRHCLTRLTQHQSQHLRSWQLAVKSIGKGTGKHANKHRKDARDHLEQCRTAIPAWIMPIYRVAETIEIKPSIFDVVIVDEASQSGPEALFLQYLAKRIVVVGDDKQISPTFVGVEKQPVDLLRDRLIRDLPHSDRLGIEHSFFDQAFIRYPSHVCLQEHFRCMPEIIQFSNNLCYSSTPLIPLKQYGGGRLAPTVKAVHVPDGYQKGRSPRLNNPPEADAVANQIAKCCADASYKGKTMGVISLLGEDQARLIQTLLLERIGPEEMEKRQIHCGDAYAFQGDERDVMFLSLVSAPGDGHRIGTLTDASAEKRFNVAASRAKEQMWLFHTATLSDLHPNCLRYKLLDYCRNPGLQQTDVSGINLNQLRSLAAMKGRAGGRPPQPFDSWFEVDVFLQIVDRGYRVIPQYRVAGYYIDLVVEGMRGCLAVECDGDEWHGPEQYESDMARQRQLERSGYSFWRVRGSAYYRSPEDVMDSLWTLLDQMRIFSGTSDGLNEPVPLAEHAHPSDDDLPEGVDYGEDRPEIREIEEPVEVELKLEPPAALLESDPTPQAAEWREFQSHTESRATSGRSNIAPTKPGPGLVRVVFRKMPAGETWALFPEIPASNDPNECLAYSHKKGYWSTDYSEAVRQSATAGFRDYISLFKELGDDGCNLVIAHRAKQQIHEQRRTALQSSLRNESKTMPTALPAESRPRPTAQARNSKKQMQLVPDDTDAERFSSVRNVLVDGVPATVVYEEHWDGKTLWYVYLDGEDEMRKYYSPPTQVVDIED